jgi:hypothetical protein
MRLELPWARNECNVVGTYVMQVQGILSTENNIATAKNECNVVVTYDILSGLLVFKVLSTENNTVTVVTAKQVSSN